MRDYSDEKESGQAWQDDIRQKITDLAVCAEYARSNLNAWELNFIESMRIKLDMKVIDVSPKQFDKICDILERVG